MVSLEGVFEVLDGVFSVALYAVVGWDVGEGFFGEEGGVWSAKYNGEAGVDGLEGVDDGCGLGE